MCAEAVNRIGNALAIFIESFSWRIECGFCRQHVTMFIDGQARQSDTTMLVLVLNVNVSVLKTNLCALAGLCDLKNFAAQCLTCHVCGFAANECLPGSRGFAAVRRDGSVAREQIETVYGAAERVSANLRHHSCRALPDVYGTLMKCNSPIGLQANTHGGGMGKGTIPPTVPHPGNANSAPQVL